MRKILAFGCLLVICAMLGAFIQATKDDFQGIKKDALQQAECLHWAPLAAHPNCKPQRCPTPEDETQMVCQ